MSRPRNTSQRQFPRTARINELLREILADALERIDDDRLVLVVVTGVECDADLRHARVFFDGPAGEAGDEAVAEALAELRPRLQGFIGRQAHLKRTPELTFEADPAIRAGEHIDELLGRAAAQTGRTRPDEVPVDPATDG